MKNFLIITMFSILLAGCTRIGPGYVGFKYSYAGTNKGKAETQPAIGWTGYMPFFSTVVAFPISMQHYVWTASSGEGKNANEEISIPMKGGASFLCDVGFNYTVNPDSAASIYFKYKTDDLETIRDGYLRTVVRNCMADVSGTITMDSLLNNLPAFQAAVRIVLADSLSDQGFRLQQFSLVSAPRPADANIAAAINNKIKAKQDAETAIAQLQSSIAESNKKIATARGDSAVLVTNAKAEAEAIKIKQHELSQTYVEYIKATQWDGKLPTTQLGNGTNFLFNSK